ncbi:MAG: hypothetical protein MUE54_04990 [Anaerolineae bacterium]|jgi:Tol biopolymer transport system component|nr:hypothetical protein [Anaerolineae bacterium]
MTFFTARIFRSILIISLMTGMICIFFLGLGGAQSPSPRIAYMSNISPRSDRWDLFMLDVQTGITLRLTRTPLINERYPAWSSDGTRLAYHANTDVNQLYDIFVMPIQNFTTSYTIFKSDGNMGELAVAYEKAMPAWSYDDQFIGFHAKTASGRFGLFMAYADGEEMRLLISPLEGMDILHYAWSPNGQDIAFTQATSSGADIYVFTIPQTIQNAMTNRANMRLLVKNASFPAWSPDGAELVYVQEGDFGTRLWIYDFATQSSRQLTPIGENLVYEETHPEWSSDGQAVIFSSDKIMGRFDIYQIRRDGQGLHRLTHGTGDKLAPDWGIYTGS